MIDDKYKSWIDSASYEELLRRWRITPGGSDPIFSGETGDYYSKVMTEKRDAVGHDEAVEASKRIGFEGG
jgi:hypothetical protein